MGRSDQLYARLPLWAQHTSVSLYGLYWRWLRFGPGYPAFVEGYQRREGYSRLQWDEWQQKRTQEILRLAVEHVPYYQQVWSPAEKQAALRGDLEALPQVLFFETTSIETRIHNLFL